MIVVSDTSVISGLIKIERLEILQSVFSSIIIPTKVRQELEELRQFGYDLRPLEQSPWIEVKMPSDNAFVQQLMININAGEAEAITLALELKADFILIDERKGRDIAIEQGLTVTGLVGILIKAKELGYLTAIKPILDALILKQFRIGAILYTKALESVNEQSID